MSQVFGASLISGAQVFGSGANGIKGSVIRATTGTGDNGPGLLYNEWDSSADDNKEFRLVIITPPSQGSLFVYEDGTFTFSGAPDGVYTLIYEVFVDGVSIGTSTATFTVGNAVVSVSVTSINSAAAIGNPTVTRTAVYSVSQAGIPGVSNVGSPTLTFQKVVSLNGVSVGASASTVGSPAVVRQSLATVLADPVLRTAGFGELTMVRKTFTNVNPEDIGSAVKFGSPSITRFATVAVNPAAISSGAAFGAPAVSKLSAGSINPDGIASGAAFGSPSVVRKAVANINPASIGSGVTFGAPAFNKASANQINPESVASGAAIGSPSVIRKVIYSVFPDSVPGSGSVGYPIVTNSNKYLQPIGVAPASSVGAPSISRFATIALSDVGEVSSKIIFGAPAVTKDNAPDAGEIPKISDRFFTIMIVRNNKTGVKKQIQVRDSNGDRVRASNYQGIGGQPIQVEYSYTPGFTPFYKAPLDVQGDKVFTLDLPGPIVKNVPGNKVYFRCYAVDKFSAKKVMLFDGRFDLVTRLTPL